MNKLINGQNTFLVPRSRAVLTELSSTRHNSRRLIAVFSGVIFHSYRRVIIHSPLLSNGVFPLSVVRHRVGVVELDRWIVSIERFQFARSRPPRTNMNKDDDMFEFNAPTTITRLCDMANTYDDGADQIFGKSFATHRKYFCKTFRPNK